MPVVYSSPSGHLTSGSITFEIYGAYFSSLDHTKTKEKGTVKYKVTSRPYKLQGVVQDDYIYLDVKVIKGKKPKKGFRGTDEVTYTITNTSGQSAGPPDPSVYVTYP
jgi:hypothetical protein